MKHRVVTIVLLLVAMTWMYEVVQAKHKQSRPNRDIRRLRIEQVNSVKFTIDFYDAIFDSTKNMIVSPFSLRVLLSLMYQVAQGNTELELQKKCYFSNKQRTRIFEKKLVDHLTQTDTLKMINRIFIKLGDSIKSEVEDILEEYECPIEMVDFKKSDELATRINDDINTETDGLITELVEPSMFTDDTILILLNTLYFKASWAMPFKPKGVHDIIFYNDQFNNQSISAMSGTHYYRVALIDDASVIEIPYEKKTNYALWILLPDDGSTIYKLQEQLSSKVMQQISTTLTLKYIALTLPIFEIETKIDAIPVMEDMGIAALFKSEELDLLDNGPLLSVDQAKQKSKIEVNVNGTIAASVSYSKVAMRSVLPRPIEFTVNRPFIFMIVTADSNEILFIGHYAKP